MPEHFSAAVTLDQGVSPSLTLTAPEEEWQFVVRVYANMLASPRDTELRMAEAYDLIRGLLTADVDPSSYGMPAIRNIDLFRVEADFGYQAIPRVGPMYRVMEVRVPLCVDDLSAFA